ncbi:MAG: hypothetical protein HY587_08750 [Candidatus Omnitrophica bacterium]|nr:hypothetical protein [Candidatus Omnitrophota bacterium]
MVRRLRVKILALVILSFLVSPTICHAKGVFTTPLVMVGTIEDMKTDGNKISFLFTGQISKSEWAQGDWDLKAFVKKLPVIVDQTFFFKEEDPVWGFRFEEEKGRASECLNKSENLTITIHLPNVYFNSAIIDKLEGRNAQIKGCRE